MLANLTACSRASTFCSFLVIFCFFGGGGRAAALLFSADASFRERARVSSRAALTRKRAMAMVSSAWSLLDWGWYWAGRGNE